MKTAELDAHGFELLLDRLCQILSAECKTGAKIDKSSTFENRVRDVLSDLVAAYGFSVDSDPHPYVFPDIVVGEYGIEVKFSEKDTWRSVANSVFESTRSKEVRHIYVVFGKMGGEPSVLWGKYEDCVIHVRTSHVPRFEVEIGSKESLFKKIGISYEDFSQLPMPEKMKHIRKYARGRLKKGERLWWLEDEPEQGHSLPLQVRLYMGLSQEDKRRLRAEAALLCPQIVKPSRSKGKYNDATIYLLTYHGVLCPQARDLFSAGSVALRSNSERGGNYIMRALQDIEQEMRTAAMNMEDALFIEYWGMSVPPQDRIKEWLKRADELAGTWNPSETLFLNHD
jgi:hypothetical protein